MVWPSDFENLPPLKKRKQTTRKKGFQNLKDFIYKSKGNLQDFENLDDFIQRFKGNLKDFQI